ncbi:MAG: hypothetical protein B7Y80_11020 [Hyphomicrobium sp. 32-62-53]|nr:MAG: hypothetical protein B7Y80_11020 [Hyphomicrobium sp. 32-62-53]
MQNPIWLAAGGVLVLLGLLLMRWASRYDAAGIAVDAAWRMARTGSTTGARDELGRVVDEQLADIRADAARMGHARTAVKHGARFFIARFVNIVGLIVIVLGLAAIAAAFF